MSPFPSCTSHIDSRIVAAINSVDFHPDGSSIATGGAFKDGTVANGQQGVVIWPTARIWDETAKVPMPLKLHSHTGDVNCVRWSHSGLHLGSCGDDAMVIIWERSGNSFFVLQKLKKHKETVLHMEWSADDSKIVSASADLTLIIWSVSGTGDVVLQHFLRGHTDVVNGCAWLSELAVVSQANDRTLRVWSSDTGLETKQVDAPFQDGAHTMPFQRVAAAPNGSFILAVHALNGGGSTLQKLDGCTFAPTTDFVGFRRGVTVVVSGVM